MSKQKTTIAITGANGFLGSELVRHFQSAGLTVIALVRNSHRFTSTAEIRYVEYDLTKPILPSLLKDVDYLVHTAYVKQNAKQPDALQINTSAARQLVDAARKNNLKKMVFMSTMSAHTGAESVYGKQKLAIEKLFQGKDSAVIRAGLIVGNGGIVKQMFDFMRSKHMVPLIGGGVQPLQIVAVYDLARVIDTILSGNHAGLFTIATPTVYRYKDFYTSLARRFSIRVLFIPLPFWLLLGVIRVIGLLHVPLAVSADNILGLKHLQSADTSSDLKKLNITLDSLEKALKNTTMS